MRKFRFKLFFFSWLKYFCRVASKSGARLLPFLNGIIMRRYGGLTEPTERFSHPPTAIPRILVYSPIYSSVSSIKRGRRRQLSRTSPSAVFQRSRQLTLRFTMLQYLSLPRVVPVYPWVLGNGIVVVVVASVRNISLRRKQGFTWGNNFSCGRSSEPQSKIIIVVIINCLKKPILLPLF